MEEKNKKKKKTSPVIIIILIVAVCVFLFAGYKLLSISGQYKAANDAYDNISSIFETADVGSGSLDFADGALDKSRLDEVPFYWDYQKLLAQNPDAIGWIYEKDLLNYPIVKAEDNDHYLHVLFDGTPNPSGTLFVDCNMPNGLDGLYAIVYGHNMNDTSMFGILHKFEQEEDFYKKHPTMHVFSKEKHYVYNVVAAYTAAVDGFTYSDPLNNADVTDFIQKAKEASIAPMYQGEITDDTNIIVLSTCTTASDDDFRFVVILSRDHEVK